MKLDEILIDVRRGARTQRSTITIIDPNHLNDFFNLIDELNFTLEIKCFLATALSGGGRVSEVLSLRPSDINFKTNEAKIKVLKKRESRISKFTNKKLKINKVYRDFPLHPVAVKYLKKLCSKYFQRIFTLDRFQIWRELKKVLGQNFCPHSLRHSHISERLHKRNQPVAKVAAVMEIDNTTVYAYNHVNINTENKNYW